MSVKLNSFTSSSIRPDEFARVVPRIKSEKAKVYQGLLADDICSSASNSAWVPCWPYPWA